MDDSGVNDNDIQELLEIVDLDVMQENNSYSPAVSNWMKKMQNKAIDGTWQVGIGAAGGVLAEALAISLRMEIVSCISLNN